MTGNLLLPVPPTPAPTLGSEDASMSCLPSAAHATWGVLQDLPSNMEAPLSIKPLMCLSLTLGSFSGLEARPAQGLQACVLQPRTLTPFYSVLPGAQQRPRNERMLALASPLHPPESVPRHLLECPARWLSSPSWFIPACAAHRCLSVNTHSATIMANLGRLPLLGPCIIILTQRLCSFSLFKNLKACRQN